MDSRRSRHMLEDAFMPKSLPMQTFFFVKEISKHIPKVASSSMSSMTLEKKLPT